MPRLAWFSPVRPVQSGISQYNHELLPALAGEHIIDLFVDGSPDEFVTPDQRVRLFNAHDFVWKHVREPYDLTVYQLGNAPCHDYMWAYLVRYPGLVALHDGQLHHARGRMLLQQRCPRLDDYRREFRFNHPDAHPDLAELGAVGLLGSLTYLWPMLRVVVESSRRVLVHNEWLAEQIREGHPRAAVDVVEMGVPTPVPQADARHRIRSRHDIAEDAVVFTAFGKVTPEKRVREALRAFALVAEGVPQAHLLVAGETVDYYDMQAEALALRLSGRVTLAGYLPDEAIDDYLAASDVCLCMRWPTSRETSASWLRCLAAGKPTISTDLVHMIDVPTLDPRNWSVLGRKSNPVGVSIDILDEAHSLKLAIRRVAADDKLRAALGSNARALWAERFSLDGMVAGYRRVMGLALDAGTAGSGIEPALPHHLRSTGFEHAESLVKEILGSEYHLRDAD
jgi:glycosyltransferase involved in cell wall biosynthesis